MHAPPHSQGRPCSSMSDGACHAMPGKILPHQEGVECSRKRERERKGGGERIAERRQEGDEERQGRAVQAKARQAGRGRHTCNAERCLSIHPPTLSCPPYPPPPSPLPPLLLHTNTTASLSSFQPSFLPSSCTIIQPLQFMA